MRRVAFHVLDAEAITLLITRITLGLSLGSAVRHLEDLRSFGVIEPTVKLLRPPGARGGRRVIVYVTPNAEGRRVEAACKLHRSLENPLHLRALELAEEIIQGYELREGINYMEILERVKGSGVTNSPGLAGDVSKILLERGVKVWR